MKNQLQGYIKRTFFVLLVTQTLYHSSFSKIVGEKLSLLQSKAVFFCICHLHAIVVT